MSRPAWFLVVCLAAGLPRPGNAAGVDALVTRAEEAAQAGAPDAQQAAGAMIDALRTSRAEDDQRQLLDGIVSLGRPDAVVPAALKRWVQANAAGPLLDLAGSSADWTVRGQAFTVLRALEPADDVLRRAAALAAADRGPQAAFIHGRGAILQAYLDSRAAPANGSAGEAGQAAVQWLRAHDVRASYDALTRAVSRADPTTVAALGDAGVGAGLGNAQQTYMAVLNGLSTACDADDVPAGRMGAVFRALKDHGFPLGYVDDMGNTLLMSAAQFCPAPVADGLVRLGVAVDPVNAQQFTPLKMALVSGKWELAKVLVDAGAHLTKAEADEIFFDPPQDANQRALLDRAAH